ncbi:Vacuolar protein sorting-associated protein 62 [Arabidopsis thaliana x Arabidopsis arenosa]|uniref:Vacuolar protein sorting-associated protein 62 n=1 Tax=Arabidopsis thaliana x Arabidopsis arenosa TaxID=1240361 RepID=A0A8T2C7X4_9BRAS|nr:Vacuolar protein sorting-associated protein 62 [Arabidopsis thaliana x Arabidopsis arenosa]
MFEAHVLHLLRRYLGEYVHGLSTEALRISVWKGDVVLKDLKLKAEALNSLKLPVAVKSGFVGTITLKVPWKSLGKEPVIVLIDRVFVLAYPAPDDRTLKEEDREKLLETKLQQIEEAETATLEARAKSKLGSPPQGNSWLGSIIATIIGNLKVSISNVHIRYEDSTSNPGHPFAAGITLAKLAAVTMDEEGNETFDTSGALDKLRKSLQLERLALYHDSNSFPWEIEKQWDNITPEEWVEMFEDGIKEQTEHKIKSKWALNRHYLLSPINGSLKYHRLGNQERNNPEIPFERASVILNDVNVTITEEQYHDWIKLVEVVSRYKTYIEISHLRPMVPVSEAPRLWWRFAAQASLQQKRLCYRFSWDSIHHLCQLRRRYIQLYANFLQQSSDANYPEMREIEKDLDSKVILLWRLLAHAKVESVKSKEAAEQRKLKKGGWFSFQWRTEAKDNPEVDSVADGSKLMEEGLTTDEWKAINKLLSHQPDEEMNLYSGKDMQNMTHFLVTVSIGQGAARIVDINQTEVLCGRFEQLDVTTKFKYRSSQCDVSLRFYGLSAPEGSLAQSVSSERKTNALMASFVNAPIGENIDWRLSATISPCHATIWTESYDRVLEFVKRSNAVSPTVALETAAVLQMKLEEVTRRAQEQLQIVLEEQSRFALDIDLDAPKVRIPLRASGSSKCSSHFLLDFGNFTLTTMDTRSEEQRQNLYSRFCISGRDIAAFFTDCGSDNQVCSLVMEDFTNQTILSPILEKADNVYSLIDRCGMAVIVDQIKVPHPSYPSTRISIQVPNIGVHFSPTRYMRIMQLFDILYGAMKTYSQAPVDHMPDGIQPWSPADLASDARILVWKGIGNSVATWQSCRLVLSGLYLYTFESEKSLDYQRYLCMAGRQVFEVPPANVGGSPYCLAVGTRGTDLKKALESSSTWIIEFQGEEKAAWLRGLVQATYQASAPLSGDVLGQTSDGDGDFHEPQTRNMKAADLVITGALVETKLYLYGKIKDECDEQVEEVLLLKVLASGGKVHVISSESGLTVRTKLHSLKIKDELQQQQTGSAQYLAYSVLKNEDIQDSLGTCDSFDKEMPVGHADDEDAYTDALPEFLSPTEPGTPDMDMIQCSMMMDSDEHVGLQDTEGVFHEKDTSQGKGLCDEVFYEVQGGEFSDFVSVVFLTRSSSSHDYNGIDTQMSIRMSKLEFFCSRPTVVALIGFGFDLSTASYIENDKDANTSVPEKSDSEKETNDESGRIEGLLGYGKDRVVFYLNMNVDNVTVFLNKEDGSQLAMFVQERFVLDIKVHPSSLSIEGTLGNFKLCDKSLDSGNCWSWLCDIRDPGVESLIKFKFSSYSAGDDDYEGYDYSLSGKLSAVRIVFLYRFVQEVTAYFMGLATPHSEEVIKLVDKVGGFEWLIQKDEMDGATAVKLDLSLDTPIIVVPRDSLSKDYIQLDLGQLEVSNEISWHGGPEKDHNAVRVDVLHAKILGLNMSVGINGSIGKPMIREGQGLDIFVRRSLRDVFQKVPTLSVEVKIDFLHAVMSDKEYDIIVSCTSMNLFEEPKLPPDFRGSSSGPKAKMRLLADKVNLNSQMIMSRTVTILAVDINYALLELRNSVNEESPLAHVALEGLWVSYRMTSLSETDLYVSVPKVSVLDIRPNTKPEMRLMLGSSVDASKQASSESFPFSLNKGSFKRANSRAVLDFDAPCSTMLLMDYRWRASSQSCVLRVQQPRILAVPDFLLAVGEFFVPALRAITGRDETLDPTNDPITRSSGIVLSEPLYKQTEDVVHLSPCRQLLADSLGIDEYTYDGCGKVISLSEQGEKDLNLGRLEPIIIVGHGKKLRFVNVKIKNGSLLSKCIYLSNDSSCLFSPEDGVDISMLENASSNPENVLSNAHKSSDVADTCQYDSKSGQSFTFEAQVVSPEFTFFDGTKSSLDDSSAVEKLLRVKLDFNFMYASKENDIWVRALLKNLVVETGSGLIILDPVDISGGYTSVKEKTNMSLTSTDIYMHLSLSALSLLLNLQSQVTGALQSGNAIPLASCTNFDRIWVSSKENGPRNNLTIWRPQAPSNYVILGDCVTSRAIPPTQAVMAVSNTYGRVRKPIGFNRIGLFSVIQGLDGANVQHSRDSNECSLWMPVAPVGYTAMGCVANIGSEPPPDHIVYCLRSDLVSSSSFSECIYTVPSSSLLESGFSIWRADNVLGSFYAHTSTAAPSKKYSSGLSHCLLWNPLQSKASSSSDPSSTSGSRSETSIQTGSSSGWDILRSISKPTSYHVSTPNFERIWWDKGGDLRRPVSIWRPIPRPGFAILGDSIIEGLEPPALGILFKADDSEIAAKPLQFNKVAHIVGKGFDEVFCWIPVAPPGYVSLGCVLSKFDEAPHVDSFCCPRIDLVNQANIYEPFVTRSSSSKSSQCWSIWKVDNQACTFIARSDHKRPPSRMAFAVGESVKPKTQENVNAEIKLRCFSLTLLDGLHGMMTPLFDTTVTNIKLATHGRPEAMNAVLISSIAASTFNPHLEAWEPLLEPFDGIFKLETYDTALNQSSRPGKRLRIATTNILNINVSAANLETLGDAVVSWRRQLELEERAAKMKEESAASRESGDLSAFSALDEDDFQTIVVENKLGRDIYLKKLEENSDVVVKLCHDENTSVWVPPPRFSNRVNVADSSREARNYMTVQILEAKGLHIIDDGNSHNFFCTLRLVVDSQGAEPQKLFPQSARTKCVKPSITIVNDLMECTSKWNELFIFEIPRKGVARLEVEVTNLAAKAGKGEVVGSLSFPVGHGESTLRKVASVRMLHQSSDAENISSYSLQRKNAEDKHDNGCLLISTSYFEKTTIPNTLRNMESKDFVDGDTGFWIGVRPDDSWHSIRSLLPLCIAPKSLQNDFIAMEVSMRNGRKHATFRCLATVVNDSDVNLEISISSDQNVSSGVSNHNAVIASRSSYVLPWGCLSKDNEQCLHVRPKAENPHHSYAWGCCTAVSSGCGKDQPFVDQGLLTRQNTVKQSSRASAFYLKLNQLEKKDMLFCCQPSTGSKPLWLSVGADASVLHTDLNTPVYDWKISISSPLKLENRLPCPVKFTVWEKTKEGTYLERQHGVVSSRKSAHVYSADIQRPVYLTLAVHGGWALEKDPIPVLDISSNDSVSSFWFVHQQSKRRLRVSIERDVGETGAAPKTIRFFVPYWITNDSYLTLGYRVVEIEPSENVEAGSPCLTRASKSFKKNPVFSMERRHQKKNVRVLEVIEDTSPMPSMLSPQESAGRSGVVLFPSQKDSYVSPRIGIAVAVRDSDNYSPGISLLELEKKERIDVKAFCKDASYYMLSAVLNMTSDRTKVIHLQPHTLFINRVGVSICLQQCDCQTEEWINPSDPPKLFGWQSSTRLELLKLRVKGYRWSTPFSVFSEGIMRVPVAKEDGTDQLQLRVQVRSGTKNSRYEVIFRPNSISGPYRIENRSMFLPIRYRQVDGVSESWQFLPPNAAASFYWEDLGRRHLFELLVDGNDPSNSEKFDIDKIGDYPPRSENGPTRPIRVTILKEDKKNIVRISDWMPVIEPTSSISRRLPAASLSELSGNESQQSHLLASEDSEFHVIVELADLGISVIDHAPEEILYMSVQNLFVAYSTGLGSGLSRFKLRIQGIQVDNQLPLAPMPVLFRPQKTGDKADYILKFSVTLQSNAGLDLRVYPYIGFQGRENTAFLINIHEPIIWRIHEMIQQANLSRLSDSKSTAVSVDPFIQIGLLNISEVRFKVSMAMSPSQRPRGVLGFWSSLMTALGNTENMPVRISERFNENISMRQSTMINNAIRNVKKDLLGQPLQLLLGVDILGNASSALGHMSQGIAALSMDKKFIQSRQRQENKGVEDFGDIIREGGGALAKGLFRGVTGILTKPLEGAKSSGVEGFVSGFGKGIIGAAAQPVSGVLDLLSKTTEGANAMRMKIAAAITSDEQLLRRRLPRAVGADSLLRPYNEYRAQGQVILQLAESGSFLGQVDLFKVRGKFALTDAYESHFILPKGKVLMITHRRVILLQQPSNIMGQRKFIPAKDACSIQWDILWNDLVTMELTDGKKDQPNSPPSRLILYLKAKPHDPKEQFRVVKCSPNTKQAFDVYSAIDQAINLYGQNALKGMVKNKVTRPYSPISESSWAEGASQQMPASVTPSSSFGTSPTTSSS